jgi:hypothetical protein
MLSSQAGFETVALIQLALLWFYQQMLPIIWSSQKAK